MKKSIKLATVFATVATSSMLAVTALPAGMALADVSQTSTNSVTENSLSSQEKLLQSNIKAVAHTEVSGDTTVVTVTDSDLVNAMKKAGYAVQPNLTRANGVGVTKIVWHGSATKGNVDLYLSKTWLNNIAAAGVGAASGALGALLPGAGWGAAIGAISAVIANQTFSSGKVFKIRSFTYAGSYNQ